MSLYQITYNNTQNVDPVLVHNVIKSSQLITDWWHYLPQTYLVNTTASSKQLADLISASFQGLLFFIVKVDLNDVNGVLAKDAWDWINRKKAVKLKLISKPSLPSAISDYLPPIQQNHPSTGNSILDALLSGKKL